jgi:hypothetical protein
MLASKSIAVAKTSICKSMTCDKVAPGSSGGNGLGGGGVGGGGSGALSGGYGGGGLGGGGDDVEPTVGGAPLKLLRSRAGSSSVARRATVTNMALVIMTNMQHGRQNRYAHPRFCFFSVFSSSFSGACSDVRTAALIGDWTTRGANRSS